MSVAFDIHRAKISVRLAGQVGDAGLLDRRLRTVLIDEVLPMAADAGESWGAEAIICVSDLKLNLELTLEEALSGEGARRWSAALIDALSDRMARGEGLWRFDNRWDFLAAYLRARLGLTAVPETAFADLGTLALLSPVQAVTEALREWPDIWPWLARGGSRAALSLLRALQAQGGVPVLTAVLNAGFPAGMNAPTAASLDVAGLVEKLRRLAADESAALSGAIDHAPDAGAVPRALFFALLLAPEDAPGIAPQLGLLLSLVTAAMVEKRPLDADADWSRLMSIGAGVLPVALRPMARDLTDALDRQPGAEAALAALAHRIIGPADARPDSPPEAEGAVSSEPGSEVAPEAETAEAARVYHSPVAGVALCLSLLAENRIGRDFPAHVRLAALAALAEGGPVERPEEDPLLQALCGQNELTELPTRPNEVDMMFVPETRRDDIVHAKAGGDRLAIWLEARFAACLPGLGASSRAFFREQFFHRSGLVTLSDDTVLIELDSMPLRPVLEMAGLIGDELARADWLDGQRIVIRLQEAAP